MDNTDIDWHPDSNDIVRDLVHPSMYPYIKGVSSLKNGIVEDKLTWWKISMVTDRL